MRSRSRRNINPGYPKARKPAPKKPLSIWNIIPVIISTVTVIAAITSAVFSSRANDNTAELDAKKFELSLFELSLPYFDNYYKSPISAVSSCQIISQLAQRQPLDDRSGYNILEMLDNIIASDRRNPETGPRPADMCRLLLQNEDSNNRPSFFEAQFVVIWNSDTLDEYNETRNPNSKPPFELALEDSLTKLNEIEPLRTIPNYGELRFLFTGKRFLIVIAVKNDELYKIRLRVLDEAPKILSEIIPRSYIWNASTVSYCRYSFERGSEQQLMAELEDDNCRP